MKSVHQQGISLLALSALLMVPASGAMAYAGPDLTEAPVYGSVKLSAGFTPDPHQVTIAAGGSEEASDALSNCAGYVAEAPDYRLEYQAGSMGLHFKVNGDVDTSLLVNLPNGQWICDDDSGGNLDPLLSLLSPMSGRYDIWVGTMDRGVNLDNPRVTLSITELDVSDQNGGSSSSRPNLDGAPTYGEVRLNAGFTPDPHVVSMTSGGDRSAASVNDSCNGQVADDPDYRLYYEAGNTRLSFKVLGKGDSTLLINTPNGNWVCDDDSGGEFNPKVTFKAPQSGRYDIWIGDFRSDRTDGQGQVSLQITEID